jgi:hypothetical protein
MTMPAIEYLVATGCSYLTSSSIVGAPLFYFYLSNKKKKIFNSKTKPEPRERVGGGGDKQV